MNSFFIHQHKRLGILLAWGAGSVLSGAVVAARSRQPFMKQYGVQAIVWGAIDAALALFGRRGAKESAARFLEGEISGEDVKKAAQGFRRILLVNAGLDVGYVLAGTLLARLAKSEVRKGIGAGIIVQGLFLMLYDTALALELGAGE